MEQGGQPCTHQDTCEKLFIGWVEEGMPPQVDADGEIFFDEKPRTGARLWARRYNGPENGFDSARALGVSSDGSSVFVAGARGSSFRNDYVIIAYAA
jgi:hypothetical protein